MSPLEQWFYAMMSIAFSVICGYSIEKKGHCVLYSLI